MNKDEVYSNIACLVEEIDITFEDVVDFWMTLFPELKSKDDLEKILEQVSKTTLKEIEKEYYSINKVELDKIFSNFNRDEFLELHFENVFRKLQKTYKWAYFFKPIVISQARTLYQIIEENNEIIENKDELLYEIILSLVNSLYEKAFKVLILETNVARMDGNLVGETSKQKADYFANVLLKDELYLKVLYEEYSELTRLMTIDIDNTLNYIKEIITNTKKEINKLGEYFGKEKYIGKLKNIVLGEGDTHNQGKTVAKLYFNSGICLVYKPRLMDLETKFYEFVSWINNQNISCFQEIKACKVHSIDNGGWMEFIDYAECEKLEEIQHFYQRIGQLLCILYTLNAKDFHYENLIAQFDQPILIDLETLLHPVLFNDDIQDTSATAMAFKIISDSVKGIALLPTQIINHKNEKVLEVGGLGAEKEQVAPFKSVVVKDYDTDEVKLDMQYGIIKPKINNPSLNGRKVSSEQFVEEIKKGFITVYQWIINNKKLYSSEIQSLFSGCLCRIIFKSTNIYSQLLNTSYHPDLLRNFIDRKIYLHRLGLVMGEEEEAITCAEMECMLSGDIPYFTTCTDVNMVLDSKKKEIKSKYKINTLESIIQKIEQLSEKDLERQLIFIKSSYLCKSNKKERNTKICFQEHDCSTKINKNQLIHTAKLIGDYVLDKSIVGKKDGVTDRTWIGSMEIGDGIPFITSVGNDLYRGNSGIALFLAYLGVITEEDKYKKAAIEAMMPIVNYLENIKELTNEKIGAFSGISGWFYALFHIGSVLNEKQLLDCVYSKIMLVKSLVSKQQSHDLISGVSGAIGTIISIYEKVNDDALKVQLINICNDIFDKLKEGILVLNETKYITWGEEGYVGYSHGNAGVSSQLARLYKITGNNDILELIKDVTLYERSMFDSSHSNWKKQYNKEEFSYGWCHGAPGILLSKLIMIESGCADEYTMEDVLRAIGIMKKRAFGNDYCLCHGDMGNISILNYAANVLNDSELKAECLATLDEFINKYFLPSWKQGEFKQIENSSLMVGIVGAGYAFLQFYKPDLLPDILSLS